MSDPSLSDQATTPDQSVVASEQAQPLTDTNVAGSAMLDANVAAGETTNPQGEAIANPIATNFSEATATGDPKIAGVSSTTGPNTTNEQPSEKGVVNLQNNPDIPNEQMQGTLPNTDPIEMPTDPETNLPE
ncbi:hypothetical protein ACF3DV_06900 [Chlorogloeopsis fritschii PCC 9212]|uniref:Uncharacterized protein n=1 Tax=Chlorogloeopsis fritschii PCC 6912 TaxID=211165 RepID=A0A433N5M8_CHLFR|nr:hypothetical protein [Chlorogloeopsis fritschii]RUR76720.1 hypothetical protein PCC6912_41240 [Chlorogloeopsis fritschii PCC 6912]